MKTYTIKYQRCTGESGVIDHLYYTLADAKRAKRTLETACHYKDEYVYEIEEGKEL